MPKAGSTEPTAPRLAVPDWDADVLDAAWAADGTIVGIAMHGTTDALVRRRDAGCPESAVESPLAGDGACCHGLHAAPDGDGFCWIQESATTRPELYHSGPHGTAALTRLNADFSEKRRLPQQVTVRWSAADGTPIEGVLTLPHSYTRGSVRLPLLLHLHGGPHSRAQNCLQSYLMPAVWAEAGYAVLAPNYRGSEGYGENRQRRKKGKGRKKGNGG